MTLLSRLVSAIVLLIGVFRLAQADFYYNGPWPGPLGIPTGFGNCDGGSLVFGTNYDLQIADDFIVPVESRLRRYTIWGLTFGLTPDGIYRGRLRIHRQIKLRHRGRGSISVELVPAEDSIIGDRRYGLEVDIRATNLGPDPIYGLQMVRFDTELLDIPLQAGPLYFSLQPVLGDWNYQQMSVRSGRPQSPRSPYIRDWSGDSHVIEYTNVEA